MQFKLEGSRGDHHITAQLKWSRSVHNCIYTLWEIFFVPKSVVCLSKVSQRKFAFERYCLKAKQCLLLDFNLLGSDCPLLLWYVNLNIVIELNGCVVNILALIQYTNTKIYWCIRHFDICKLMCFSFTSRLSVSSIFLKPLHYYYDIPWICLQHRNIKPQRSFFLSHFLRYSFCCGQAKTLKAIFNSSFQE